VAGEAAVVHQAFAIVATGHAEGRCRHRRLGDRITDAVEGDQAQGLLHLGTPLGQAALHVGLKGREAREHLVLHMGRLGRGREVERLNNSCNHWMIGLIGLKYRD